MPITKTRLIFNIGIIVIALIIATMTYPSQIAGFCIMLATLGILVTLEKIFKPSRKTIIAAFGIFFVAVLLISFYS